MSETKAVVYKVDSGTVTVGGEQIPVASFALYLSHNGIPMLRVVADPIHKVGDKSEPATKATLDLFVTRWKTLQKAAERRDSQREATFDFKMTSDAGDVQSLKLEKWILTGAGFAGLSASGSLQLELDIQHPIRTIAESTINLFGFASYLSLDISQLKESKPANLFKGLQQTLKMYSDAAKKKIQGLASDPQYAIVAQRFSEMVTAFPQYLKWSGQGSWPDVPFAAVGWDKYTACALWDYVFGVENVTLWDWLSHTICSEWSCSIIPDYWEKQLPLCPYKPWAEPEVTVTDLDLADITLPPCDPTPCWGAYTLTAPLNAEAYTSFQFNDVTKTVACGVAVWTEATAVPGALKMFNIPAWATMLGRFAAGERGGTSETQQRGARALTEYNAFQANEGLGTPNVAEMKALIKALKSFAKQYFTEEYHRMYQVSLSCRCMLSTPGSSLPEKRVTAGHVYKLTAGGGSPVLRFFATHVVHVVDCVRKIASTQIVGNYLSEYGGPNLEAIKNGIAKNYLYEEDA